jgi:hypothetical protein
MKKVCILGTCRVSNLPATFIKFINPDMDGGGCSKLYVTEKNVEIHTQPITYSTKLADVRDILKYLQGKIYEHMDPNNDISLFNTFFRGINQRAFDNKILKNQEKLLVAKTITMICIFLKYALHVKLFLKMIHMVQNMSIKI